MNKLKKFTALILALLSLTLFVACGEQKGAEATANTDSYKFGIITMVENTAFTDMKQGIMDGLKSAGYENSTIDYQCAGGDAGTLQTIASSMNDGSYTAVFCIATPTTQAFVNLASQTPCFFCAVSAPTAAGVITELTAPDKNATGTSNAIPVADILDMANKLTPGIKKYGLISSGTETNATNTIELVKEALGKREIEYYEVFAETSSDVATAANALVDAKCDAVFIPNDSVIQAGIASLADICNTAKIPTFAASKAMITSGCLATLAIDDIEIGKLTASMCDEYIKGKKVTEIPTIICDKDYCSVTISKVAQEKLGIEVPAEIENPSYIEK